MNALNAAWQNASQQMYQQSGAAGQPGGDQFQGGQQQAQQEGPKAEDIQDADFEEVKYEFTYIYKNRAAHLGCTIFFLITLAA